VKLVLSPEAIEDLSYWASTDTKTLKRIIKLLKEIAKQPFKGMGKPEKLKFNLQGFYSRRISLEHRIIYTIHDDTVVIVSLKDHYN
jgi:toxin YoeB